jgi:hypothetical protein
MNERKRVMHIVAVYDVDLSYGGPAEGGWWYDRGQLVRIVRVFKNEDLAHAFCRRMNGHLNAGNWGPNAGKPERHSVIARGWISAEVHEDTAPERYPDRTPHYE